MFLTFLLHIIPGNLTFGLVIDEQGINYDKNKTIHLTIKLKGIRPLKLLYFQIFFFLICNNLSKSITSTHLFYVKLYH